MRRPSAQPVRLSVAVLLSACTLSACNSGKPGATAVQPPAAASAAPASAAAAPSAVVASAAAPAVATPSGAAATASPALPPSVTAAAAPAAALPPAAVPSPGALPAAATAAGNALDDEIRQVDEQRRRGNLDAASAGAKALLAKAPDNVRVLMLAAIIEGSTGRGDDAMQHFKLAVDKAPDNPMARKFYASGLMHKGDAAQAHLVLAPLLKVTPIDPQAHTMAAEMAAQAQDFDGARLELERVFKAAPGFAEAHVLAARIALARRKMDEAHAQFEAVVKLQPGDLSALVALASLDGQAGKEAQSRHWLEQARKERPEAPEAWLASADNALRFGHPDQATGYQATLERLIPGNPATLALKGQIALAQGRAKDAVEPLDAAYGKRPDQQVLVLLYQALAGSGQQAEADKRLDAWLGNHSDDLRMRMFAAQMAERRQDFAAANVQFRRILEKDPDNVLVLSDLAQSLQAQKDPTAEETAERAWKLKPDNPLTEDILGSILIANGKADRGLGLLKQAASHAPDNPDVRFDYARALASTGDNTHARSELQSLLALKRPFRGQEAARDMLKKLEGG